MNAIAEILDTLQVLNLYAVLGISAVQADEEDRSVSFKISGSNIIDEMLVRLNRNDEYEASFYKDTEEVDSLEGVAVHSFKKAVMDIAIPFWQKPLNHPKDEYALDTLDAMIFGDLQLENIDRMQHILARWQKQLAEKRQSQLEWQAIINDPNYNDEE